MTMPVAFRGPGRLYLTIPGVTPPEVEAHCELLGAKMVPTSDVLEVVGGCGGISAVGPARWAFNLSHVQDLSTDKTLTRLAKAHHGQLADFVFVPNGLAKTAISTTAPGYTGQTTVVASDIGATATELAQAAPVWPILGEPTEITVPPVVLLAALGKEAAPASRRRAASG